MSRNSLPSALGDQNIEDKKQSHTIESTLSEKGPKPLTTKDAAETAQSIDSNGVPQEIDIEQAQPAEIASSKPYSSFLPREKILIVMCATFGGFFSPMTTNIYFPALETIASDLKVSISAVNLTITTYMIFQAITPTFISTFTDTQGRRPTYIVGFLIYIGANIGLALNNSYAGLLVLRCLQSCGSSGLATIQQAIIADVVTSAERGSYIGITSMTSILAPSVAPIIGGVLSQHLGWHSIFWFLSIMSGVYLVPLLAFMPETSRKLVGDGSTLPPKTNMSILNLIQHHRSKSSLPSTDTTPPRPKRKPLSLPNPLPTLSLFLDPLALALIFFASIAYATFYAISSTITVQFSQIYHLSPTHTGLLFLPQAVGSILAAVTNSFFLDWNYRRYCRKYNFPFTKSTQIDLADFPIERARLQLALPLFVIMALAMIVYGWLLEIRAPMAAPIALLVVIGFTLMAGFNALSVLMIDAYRHKAAAASAASNLSRCLMGAALTAGVNPLIEAVGCGWCFTITGAMLLGCTPVLWVVMRFGMKWRAKRGLNGKGI